MTDIELTKAVIGIYRKACADAISLVKAQGVPVYTSMYGMRRWFKHNDNSSLVSDGRELLNDVASGMVKAQRGSALAQATPSAVKKLKDKIVKEIVRNCRRDIENASAQIVKSEATIREVAKAGKLPEKHLRKLLTEKKV